VSQPEISERSISSGSFRAGSARRAGAHQMPPEPHGPEDDGISHPPLQPADPQGGEGARRTQGEVEGQVQEGDGPGGEEEGSGERLAGHMSDGWRGAGVFKCYTQIKRECIYYMTGIVGLLPWIKKLIII